MNENTWYNFFPSIGAIKETHKNRNVVFPQEPEFFHVWEPLSQQMKKDLLFDEENLVLRYLP